MSDVMLYTTARRNAKYWTSRARYWMAHCWRDGPALVAVMFHAMVKDRDEINRGLIDPALCITVDEFRDFVQFYLANGYRFVAPSEVVFGLPTDGKYALITFDDGYFNNRLALPVLHELQVPAVFSITTANVQSGKSFWWDVLYRERVRQGTALDKIDEETSHVKALPWSEVESYLAREFGTAALQPTGELDRPFDPDELADFSRDPYVHLGNHTVNHPALANLTELEVREQIETAQADLHRMCGVDAQLMAYPHGVHSASICQAARNAGLVLGVTVENGKNYLPLDPGPLSLLALRRCRIRRDQPFLQQLEIIRGDFGRWWRKPRAMAA